jgi:hypothetical protein
MMKDEGSGMKAQATPQKSSINSIFILTRFTSFPCGSYAYGNGDRTS